MVKKLENTNRVLLQEQERLQRELDVAKQQVSLLFFSCLLFPLTLDTVPLVVRTTRSGSVGEEGASM